MRSHWRALNREVSDNSTCTITIDIPDLQDTVMLVALNVRYNSLYRYRSPTMLNMFCFGEWVNQDWTSVLNEGSLWAPFPILCINFLVLFFKLCVTKARVVISLLIFLFYLTHFNGHISSMILLIYYYLWSNTLLVRESRLWCSKPWLV